MKINDVASTLNDISTNKLTSSELVLTELKGKFIAVERYDSILWKIRSGYVVVLYGALAVTGSTGLDISSILGDAQFLAAIILLIWGFSLCGFFIDFGFLQSKLRVVVASNQLYKLALRLSLGKTNFDQEYEMLQELLQNSGESLNRVPANLSWNALRWLIPLYFGTPVIGTLIYIMSFVSWQ